MTAPQRPGRLELAAAVLLFSLAAWLRLRDFRDLPVHGDWSWFLRASNDLAALRFPEGLYAYLYSSLPPALFGAALRITGGLAGALALWGLLASLAPPLLFWALRERAGRSAALLCGLVLASSPVEVRFGRGLESPYLISLFVSLLVLGLLLGRSRHPLGPVWTVLGGAGAAGMHLGLAPLALLGCAFAAMDLLRQPARRLASAAACFAVGLPLALLVWVLDRGRLEDDLSMRSSAVDSYGSEELAGSMELLSELPATIGLGGFRLWVLGALVLGLLVAGRLGPQAEQAAAERPPALPRLLLFLLVGLAPYLVMGLQVGYLSDDHAGGLAALALATLCIGTSEGLGNSRLRPFGLPALAAIWLLFVLSSSSFADDLETSAPDKITEFVEAQNISGVIAERAQADDAVPWVLVERGAGFDNLEARQGRLLNELPRTATRTEGRGDSCFLLLGADRAGSLGLVSLPLVQRDNEAPFVLLHDPGCAAVLQTGSSLCALLPAGLDGRAADRLPRRSPPFDDRHLPCLSN